jgi:hypothetical protein
MQICPEAKHLTNTWVGWFFLLIIGFMLMNSCRKDDAIDTSPGFRLAFSNDTIIFDTVFTTIGSVTKQLHVYNRSNKAVIISSVRLARGETSPFRLNIDGRPSLSSSDIELKANDSLYIFIRVTIDPNNTNNPLVQSDSISFTINGHQQNVKLVAWGQDAYFYANARITRNYTFTNDKPHVIYGQLIIDSLYTLTIEPGAKIYFHKDAQLVIYRDATLKVNGTLENPVIFQADRLEHDYDTVPGQWGSIWLYAGSKNNEIDYAEIRNAQVGIQVDAEGILTEPELLMSNTRFSNITNYGLLARGAWIKAVNCVFDGFGGNAIAFNSGGNYDLRHCTIGNYWMLSARRTPSLSISNYYIDQKGVSHLQDLQQAYFGNCIIYGEKEEEISLQKKEGAAFNVVFENCLLRTILTSDAPALFSSCIRNKAPQFKNLEKYFHNLELDTLSPAKDVGAMQIISGAYRDITIDIKGVSRILDAGPDLGAYERVEPK